MKTTILFVRKFGFLILLAALSVAPAFSQAAALALS